MVSLCWTPPSSTVAVDSPSVANIRIGVSLLIAAADAPSRPSPGRRALAVVVRRLRALFCRLPRPAPPLREPPLNIAHHQYYRAPLCREYHAPLHRCLPRRVCDPCSLPSARPDKQPDARFHCRSPARGRRLPVPDQSPVLTALGRSQRCSLTPNVCRHRRSPARAH